MRIADELQDTLHSEEDFNRTLILSQTDSAKDERIKDLIEWDIEHGEIEKAKELLKKEIELYKTDSIKHMEVLKYAADKYLSIGDTIESISLYQQLSQEYPYNSRFPNQLGVLFVSLNNNSNAIKEFKKAVEIEPENDIYLYNLGITYLKTKNKSQAKIYFKKSMELGNKDACKNYRELTARTKYYKRSRCCDGSTSSALGRGACSHHGGVCRIENVPFKDYTITCR